MKRLKKIAIATCLSSAVLVSACLLSQMDILQPNASEENESVFTMYEYALLGETYIAQEGFQGGVTPRGDEIAETDKEVFLDWASGSYIFHYEGYDVNLKVYEESPNDVIEYTKEFTTAVAGYRYELPSAKISSGIVRTDGASKIEDYAYVLEVSNDTEVLASFKHTQVPEIAFPIGGEYTISYQYENVFGEQNSFNLTVDVVDEKVIIEDLQASYYLGSTLNFSEIYGLYCGETYEVYFSAVSPSGETMNQLNSLFLGEIGTWTVTAQCYYGEEMPVEKQFQIETEMGLGSFMAGLNSTYVSGSASVPENYFSNERELVVLSPMGSSMSVSYNGVVDLREMSYQDTIVSFLPNLTTGDGISSAKIVLTDVYDSFNTLTVSFIRNGTRTETGGYNNVLMTVSYGAVTTGTANYTALSGHAVAWGNTFYTYWASTAFTGSTSKSLYPFNVSYDMKTNKVYSYGNFDLIDASSGAVLKYQREQWCEVANLSDSNLVQTFKGFTTGEVYVRIETSGFGDLGVITLGGKSASSLTIGDYSSANDILLGTLDLDIVGIVGVEYPLPEVMRSNFLRNDITCSMYDPDGNEVVLNKNSFMPEKAGEYTLVYSTTNSLGLKAESSHTITIAEKETPISILYKKPSQVTAGDLYQIEAPIITGGMGLITYKLFFNDEEVKVGSFVKISSAFKLEVLATDYFGFEKSRTFTSTVDKNAIEMTCEFPLSAICASTFVIPRAEIYSYMLGGVVPSYEVYMNGELLMGTEVTLPAEPCEIEFEYRTNDGSVSYTLNVIKPVTPTTKIEEFLAFEGTGGIYELGSEVIIGANESVVFPYKVSSTGLDLIFSVKKEDLNYDKITFVLADQSGQKVTIGLDGLMNKKAEIIINGVATSKFYQGLVGVGNDAWDEEYKGKEYYTFSLKYDDSYRYVLSGNKPIVEVNKYLSGLEFNGFGDGVYLSFYVEELSEETATVCIQRISNQTFNQGGFMDGDVVAPEVYSNGCAGNKIVEKGYELDFSSVKAFDVMSKDCTVTVTVADPNRKTILKDVSPAEVKGIILDSYGVYRINVLVEDAAGNFANKTYNYTVADEVPPTLTVSNVADIDATVGSVINLFDATVTDNSNEACFISVFIRTVQGKVEILLLDAESVSGLTYVADVKGTYDVWYQATDKGGNVTVVKFVLNVR